MDKNLTFKEIVAKKDELIAEARNRMKYEVFLTVRDIAHYLLILEDIVNTVSTNVNDFGVTDMVITEFLNKDKPCNTSVLIFKDMPEGFDPVAYGIHLTNLQQDVNKCLTDD